MQCGFVQRGGGGPQIVSQVNVVCGEWGMRGGNLRASALAMAPLSTAAISIAIVILERVVMVVSCLSRKGGIPFDGQGHRKCPRRPMCWRAQKARFRSSGGQSIP